MTHYNIVIDPSALRSREKMFRKYGKLLGREGPRFAKSNVAKAVTDDEPRLCVEGIGVLTETPVADKNGTIFIFGLNAFDDHVANRTRTEFWLGHDPTKVVGSTSSGLELCLLENGVGFRMPLTNKQYATTIQEMIQSGEQSNISIGFTSLVVRDEVLFGHPVKLVDKAEIREISLVPRGACKAAFARLIDANFEPPLTESVSSDWFTIEYDMHTIKRLDEDNRTNMLHLAHRLTALKTDLQYEDNEPIRSSTASELNESDMQRIERMQKERRAKLRSM